MWGPEFIRDILVTPELEGSTITLCDINPEPLDLVYALGQKLIRDFEKPFILEKTTNLDEALHGAGAVILTITTGGLEAMRQDIEIPQKYGIYQSVGDTVGPGGLSRALRSIPVVVGIAQKMESICPQAWLLNYTNPMTVLCRAVTRQTKVKTVGLCHELIGVLGTLKEIFEARYEDLQVWAGGINHLIWILELKVRGRDVFPELLEMTAQILGEHELSPRLQSLSEKLWQSSTSMVDRWKVKAHLLRAFGALPAAGDRHVAEFFPYFITEASGWGKQYGIELTSVDERYLWRQWYEMMIRSGLAGESDLAAYMKEHSGEAASRILRALANGGEYTGIMNLPNQGQVENLPNQVVLETFGTIRASGAEPKALGKLPPGIQSVLARHVSNQELIVEAALSGDRSLVLQALLNDPLLKDISTAPRMLDELIQANRQYLLQF